jgi:hypothetical protein
MFDQPSRSITLIYSVQLLEGSGRTLPENAPLNHLLERLVDAFGPVSLSKLFVAVNW